MVWLLEKEGIACGQATDYSRIISRMANISQSEKSLLLVNRTEIRWRPVLNVIGEQAVDESVFADSSFRRNNLRQWAWGEIFRRNQESANFRSVGLQQVNHGRKRPMLGSLHLLKCTASD